MFQVSKEAPSSRSTRGLISVICTDIRYSCSHRANQEENYRCEKSMYGGGTADQGKITGFERILLQGGRTGNSALAVTGRQRKIESDTDY